MDRLTDALNGLRKNLSQAVAQGGSDLERFECATCRDEEWIIVQTPHEVELSTGETKVLYDSHAELCPSCAQRKKVARLFRSSRITDGFQRLTFDGFRVEGRPRCVRDAMNAALDYVERFAAIHSTPRNSIALLGPPGSGKTHLLTAVSNALLGQGVAVHYFPWVEGSNELRGDLDAIQPKLDAMRTADGLYIDDVFKGRKVPTDFQLEWLFDVVNFRYMDNRPILVSSERDVDALCVVDEGIGSRLYERAKDYTVIMKLAADEKSRLNYRLGMDDRS